MIEKSLRNNGAARSIVLDKNNRIIAGNKTIENAASIGMEDVIIVETKGDKIVAVKRTDIDLNSEEGRRLALADNATSKANIEWDSDTLLADWDKEELKQEYGIFLNEDSLEDNQEDKEENINKDIIDGDLIQLGDHLLLCGEYEVQENVDKLLEGKDQNIMITNRKYCNDIIQNIRLLHPDMEIKKNGKKI